MPLDHNMVRRLAFVKYLFNTSVSQSKEPVPLCCASLLTMHDAVEFFLQLASEHLNVTAPRREFMEYWDVLSRELGRDLQQKESMRRLNKARVALKHHGTFPSQLDIEAFRASTISFFEDNTPILFEVSLADISLIEYVNPESARQKLKESETDIAAGKTLEALDKIAIAFKEMIDDYESRKRDRFHNSPFHFGPHLGFLSSFSMGLHGSSPSSLERELGLFVDRVKESLEAIQEAIKILALGLDYRKYSRFRDLTPFVLKTGPGGNYQVGRIRDEKTVPSPGEARFCIDFTIESALALSEFDHTIELSEK